MPRPILGPPVQGGDFFDRVPDLRRLLRHLETDHVLLLAPRRVGKTSLLFKLRDTAPERSERAVYASVSSARDELDVVRKLLRAVAKVDAGLLERMQQGSFARSLARWLPTEVQVAGVGVTFADAPPDSWDDMGRALAEALDRHGHRWLLLVDELPVFLSRLITEHGVARARVFLDWMRELRQVHPNVRWVIAGSIGLDTIADLHDLTSTINDLRLFHLGAFPDDVAHDWLKAVAQASGLELSTETRDRVLERVGWPIPYFLNLLLSGLRDLDDEGVPPSPEAVDEAYSRLLTREHVSYFAHWRQRLALQLDAGTARRANALLDAAAKDPHGASDEVLRQVHQAHGGAAGPGLPSLLHLLLADGYLAEVDGRYRFRSPLLRDYWRWHATLENDA